MTGNLPPGVTPSDIDDHFGTPEQRERYVGATVAVDVLARGHDDEAIERDAKEQIREAFDDEVNAAQLIEIEIEMIE